MNAPNLAVRRPPPQLGFKSLEKEVALDSLEMQGAPPPWLRGSLLRVGPAKFEVGSAKYQHWFDGLSMLHRFSFEGGRISYANRFLASSAYRQAMQKGRIVIREFATMPHSSFFARAVANLFGATTDNANVNITRMGGHVVALTETTHAMQVDPWTLDFTGEMSFGDRLSAQVWTAHPQYDFKAKKLYNLLVSFGPFNNYKFYSMAEGSNERVLLTEIPSANPSYIHSFGMTENYLILTEVPHVVTSIKLKVGTLPFIENYRWEPNRGVRMTVIRKSDGRIMGTHQADPFFTFHHVNAFEEDGDVVVDLIRFSDNTVIDKLYLKALETPNHSLGALERFRLPIGQSTNWVRSKRLSSQAIELPNVNYRNNNGLPYKFTYAVGDGLTGAFALLAKIDVSSGTDVLWQEENCHPGEPVFVGAPDSKDEDDGVILSVVLDETRQTSFLLVLDARTMKEVARAHLPHHIPFGFHGQYFDDVRRPPA